jgi:predicted component of type VI protein secretion system
MQLSYHDELGTQTLFTCTDFPCFIGRSAECHLSINIPTVSRKHASITHLGGTYIISNLSDTNPLYVDGDVVGRIRLEKGSHIQMGELELWVETI